MISAFVQRDIYQSWLKKIAQERNTAKLQGLEECQRCGFCCARRTCVPLPDELESIAAALHLSVDKMIGTYMVGDEQSTDSGGYAKFLRWANTAQTDAVGTFLGDGRTYDKGDCVLYDAQKRKCLIWSVRPLDARQTTCWKDYEGEDARDAWADGQLEELCPWMNTDGWDGYDEYDLDDNEEEYQP